jgi:hypothetical protein
MGGLFKLRRILGGLMSGRVARPTASIFAKCSKRVSGSNAGPVILRNKAIRKNAPDRPARSASTVTEHHSCRKRPNQNALIGTTRGAWR